MRPAVVLREDLVVRAARVRHPDRAHLAHADAPKPAPSKTNMSPSRFTVNSVDFSPPSVRRILRSPAMSMEPLSPLIAITPMRPDTPRCFGVSDFTRPISG
jgi:hypothetical protein